METIEELANSNELVESFERHYYPYDKGDGVSNARALENAFEDGSYAKTWLFTLYLGLGIESIESILWLTEAFFLNNTDIPL